MCLSFFVPLELNSYLKGKDQRIEITKLHKFFNKNNLEDTNLKLFTNDLLTMNLWLLNGNTQLVISDASSNSLPDDKIEFNLLNSLKDFDIEVKQLRELIFSKVLSLAKRVRTETAIGRNPVSVAYASVSLASRIFSDLSACKVVLIGAGQTIQLVAEHLNGQGVRGIDVINRTLANAETLAAAIDGYAWSLSYLGERIQKADIVIASTSSTIPVLGKGAVERAQKIRRHKPMFLVDLAVPRDIESEVGDLESVYLYTVDDSKFECDQVKKTLPEVMTLQLPEDASDFIEIVESVEQLSITICSYS